MDAGTARQWPDKASGGRAAARQGSGSEIFPAAGPARGAGRAQQHGLPVPLQRVHEHRFGRLGRRSAPGPARLRLPQVASVGGAVAGALVPLGVDIGLHQHGPHAVRALPVVGQLAQVQGREVVQQAAQQAPVTVLEEVAQVGAEGLAVAQRV